MVYELRREAGTRKDIARAIAGVTGEEVRYMGMPTASYRIGDIILDRDWNLVMPEIKEAAAVLEALIGIGAIEKLPMLPEEQIPEVEESAQQEEPAQSEETTQPEEAAQQEEAGDVAPDYFTVRLEMAAQPPGCAERFQALAMGKEKLICHALGVEKLAMRLEDDAMVVDWWQGQGPAEEYRDAHMAFLLALWDLAGKLKRVNARSDREVANEKYAFRCFMLRMGLSGPEHKKTRQILMANLEGNSAFRDGRKKS